MPEQGNAFSGNPNLCASCSSLADGMEEPTVSELQDQAPAQGSVRKRPEQMDKAA